VAIIVDNFSGTPFEGKGETIQLDYAGRTDGQPVYVGFAEPSSLTSDPVWKIMRLDYSAGGDLIDRLWADGDTNFDNIWNNRTTLSYS
jgi:hypothetical protein